MRSTFIVILLAFPCAAADAPAIVQKSPLTKTVVSAPPFKVGDFQVFSLENYASPVTWEVKGDCVKLHELTKAATRLEWPNGDAEPVLTDIAAGTLLIRGQKPGTATLEAWGVVDGRAKKLAVRVIEVEGARPPPIPPDPDPKPQPTPTGEAAWIGVIEETSARTPETAKVLADLKAWNSLTAKGHQFRFYDKDAKDIPGGWVKAGETLPVLLIVSKSGHELYRGPLLASHEAIAKLVAERTGVK